MKPKLLSSLFVTVLLASFVLGVANINSVFGMGHATLNLYSNIDVVSSVCVQTSGSQIGLSSVIPTPFTAAGFAPDSTDELTVLNTTLTVNGVQYSFQYWNLTDKTDSRGLSVDTHTTIDITGGNGDTFTIVLMYSPATPSTGSLTLPAGIVNMDGAWGLSTLVPWAFDFNRLLWNEPDNVSFVLSAGFAMGLPVAPYLRIDSNPDGTFLVSYNENGAERSCRVASRTLQVLVAHRKTIGCHFELGLRSFAFGKSTKGHHEYADKSEERFHLCVYDAVQLYHERKL